MRRVIKSILLLCLAVTAVIVALAIFRAATLPSLQIAVEPAPPLDLDLDAAVGRLQHAVRIATVSSDEGPPDAVSIAAFHAFLEEAYPRVHAAFTREVVSAGSLLYTWPGRDIAAAPVVLLGHFDVVPPGDLELWTHPPFSGRVTDGHIWGRGTLDNKINVLGLLEAAELLLEQGVTPARTVLFAFGHDEEILGADGAAKIAALLAERGTRPEFVLDEGMLIVDGVVPGAADPVAILGVAEKGYVTFELTARAAGGHSSTPPPDSAVGRLARALARLDAIPQPAGLDAPITEFLRYLAPEMPFGRRLALANLWLTAPLVERLYAANWRTDAVLRTTTALTVVDAGVKDNVLPTAARARVNFRIHPRDSIAGVAERVRRIIGDPEIEQAIVGTRQEPSPISPLDGSGFRYLQRTIGEVFPAAIVVPGLVLGGTDSRHYAALTPQIYRFTPMVLGPDDLPRVHGVDERLPVEVYARSLRFYARLLEQLDAL